MHAASRVHCAVSKAQKYDDAIMQKQAVGIYINEPKVAKKVLFSELSGIPACIFFLGKIRKVKIHGLINQLHSVCGMP
jgi:hypothetical protein